MRIQSPLQLLIALLITVIVLLITAAILSATDTALSLWQRLQQLSPWVAGLYLAVLSVAALTTLFIAWRVIKSKPASPKPFKVKLSRESLASQLEEQRHKGVDIQSAQVELDLYDHRQSQNEFYIALYGTMSSGKSSLINALLPNAQQATSVIGGTTQEVVQFQWQPPLTDTSLVRTESPEGEPTLESIARIHLLDMPGFNQNQAEDLALLASQEAQRAHIVLFVCDNDLTRHEYDQLQQLIKLNKPIIIVLNKADNFSKAELSQLEGRLNQYLPATSLWELVTIQTGGIERVVVIDAQGREHEQARPRPSHIHTLRMALARWMDDYQDTIAQARADNAVQLAHQQLLSSQQLHREQQATRLVRQYARRAMLGAMAAIAPGTDLVIQGALGTALTRALCQLYEIPVRDVDIDRFLNQAGNKLQRNTSITLAVAGNALKAFPGIGTIAGGLVHALAYGMIFHSLGQALAQSLAQATQERTNWQPNKGAKIFEEQLLEHLETPAKYLVQTAVENVRQRQLKE